MFFKYTYSSVMMLPVPLFDLRKNKSYVRTVDDNVVYINTRLPVYFDQDITILPGTFVDTVFSYDRGTDLIEPAIAPTLREMYGLFRGHGFGRIRSFYEASNYVKHYSEFNNELNRGNLENKIEGNKCKVLPFIKAI